MSAGTAAERGAYPAPPGLARLRRVALAAGGLAAVASAIAAFVDPAPFFRSYLVGFLFWLGITLGCFALAMLHHLTGGAWGVVIRRVLEAASRTLPLMAVLFLPLLAGLSHLYVWARPEWGERGPDLDLAGTIVIAAPAVHAHKASYLNLPAFALRALVYFAVLGAITFFLNRWSLEQDSSANPSLRRRMRLLSGPGLGLYCIAATFASVDWLMSLDPRWVSSIVGVGFVGGQALAAIAFAIVAGFFLARRPPMDAVLSTRHFHDYGNLMLAFVMLWGYFSVSQLIIIWSGNLPEEISFYLRRLAPGWQGVGLVLLLGHFTLPFLLLVSRSVKRRPSLLAAVAGFVLVMRWVDLYWQAAPAFHPLRPRLGWLDLAVPVAIGGAWLAVFARELGKRPLLPLNDPQLEEALAHEG